MIGTGTGSPVRSGYIQSSFTLYSDHLVVMERDCESEDATMNQAIPIRYLRGQIDGDGSSLGFGIGSSIHPVRKHRRFAGSVMSDTHLG